MYCKNCGAQVDDKAVVCLRCGFQLAPIKKKPADDGSLIWTVVGFFVPVAALVLYLIWKDDKPKCAKRAALGGLICLGMSLGAFLFTLFLQVGITALTLLFRLIAGV